MAPILKAITYYQILILYTISNKTDTINKYFIHIIISVIENT